MPLLNTPETEEWRTILTAQAYTTQQHKLARAAAVRRYIDLKAAEMWARVEEDTADTAELAWRADVEAKVLWGVYGGRTSQTETDE